MMKFVAVTLLGLMLIFMGVRIYSFWSEEKDLNSQLSDIDARLTKAQTQEANMQSDVQYLSDPANLEKELRARFNYKKPGETMVVIVSDTTSTASSSE